MKLHTLTFLLFLIPIYGTYSDSSIEEASMNENSEQGFWKNQGQVHDQNGDINDDVLFSFAGDGINTHLKSDGFSYDTYQAERKTVSTGFMDFLENDIITDENNELNLSVLDGVPDYGTATNLEMNFHRIDVSLKNANPDPEIKTQQALSGRKNFFNLSHKPEGVGNVTGYKKVTYKDIYPGIDMVFRPARNNPQNQIEYDFIIHPEGNISDIKLTYKGATPQLSENKQEIEFELAHGKMIESIPASWVNENEGKKEVEVYYEQIDKNTFAFQTEATHDNGSLIIDPTPNIEWATYYGGSNFESITDMATDQNGNLYATGNTNSTSNIATTGTYQNTFNSLQDAYVVKFDETGNREWGTYYGSDSIESAGGIDVNSSGEVFVGGYTTSFNAIATSGTHETTNPSNDFESAMLFKLDSQGQRDWGTYYGGDFPDRIRGVSYHQGQVYTTGVTFSLAGISTSGTHQENMVGTNLSLTGFVNNFNDNGTLNWGTYYGGEQTDNLIDISVYSNSDIYVVGYTESPTNITSPGAHRTTFTSTGAVLQEIGVLGKFDNTGNRDWGTYIGEEFTRTLDVTVNSDNEVAIAGIAYNNVIGTAGTYQSTPLGYPNAIDAYVSKFDNTGTQIWGTYYSGDNYDQINGIATDECGRFIIGGYTFSSNNIATSNGFQTSMQHREGFMARLNPDGTQDYGTYFGGSDTDLVNAVATTDRNIYFGGHSQSNDLPTQQAHQSSYPGGDQSGFLSKFEVDTEELSIDLVSKQDPSCFNSSDGSIVVSGQGGARPHDFSWDEGANDSIITDLTQGEYKVTLEDDAFCTVEDSFNLNAPDSILINVEEINPPTCPGDGNGNIAVTAHGGQGPYQYNWDHGPTDTNLTGIEGGEFILTVEDQQGCSRTDTFVVQDAVFEANITSIIHPTCVGSEDGHINVEASGGSAPYQYTWDHGPTGDEITDLEAGEYYLMTEDQTGCTLYDTFEIVDPEPITVAIDEKEHISCPGNEDGSISVNVSGGTGNLSLSWDHGPSGNYISNLDEGDYFLTVEDDNGCMKIDTFSIIEPDSVNINVAEEVAPSCYNEDDGSITAAASGGTGPYQYTWDNGTSDSINSSIERGEHTVFVEDANGCSASSTFSLEAPDSLTVDFDPTPAVYSCNGEVTANVSGGTSPYTYEWDDGQTGSTADELCTGPIEVTITDDNGCTITETVEIEEGCTDYEVELINKEDVFCSGAGDGSIEVEATGGTEPYTYSWSHGENGNTVTDLDSGDYSVVVTDDLGCIDSMDFHISEPEPLTLDFDIEHESGNCEGSAEAIVEGGVEPYEYEWETGEIMERIFSLCHGSYDLTVTDDRGCTVDGTAHIIHTNISDKKSENSIQTYPNPVDNELTIEGSILTEVDKIKIHDLTGRVVYYESPVKSRTEHTFDLSEMEVGSYLLILEDDNGEQLHQEKLLKE